MLPDTKYPSGTRTSGFSQIASDFGRIAPLLLVAVLASFLLGANTVEIQAIWNLKRRSNRIGPRFK